MFLVLQSRNHFTSCVRHTKAHQGFAVDFGCDNRLEQRWGSKHRECWTRSTRATSSVMRLQLRSTNLATLRLRSCKVSAAAAPGLGGLLRRCPAIAEVLFNGNPELFTPEGLTGLEL